MSLQAYITHTHTSCEHPICTTQAAETSLSHNTEVSHCQCVQCVQWAAMLDDFLKQIYTARQLWSVAKPYPHHTRDGGKKIKHCIKTTGCSPKKYHLLQEKIHPKYTSFSVGCALSASSFWLICVSQSWTLCTCQNLNTFSSQLDVYKCTGLQMRAD